MTHELRATVVTAAAGMALAERAETTGTAMAFAGSLPWLQAAERVLGRDQLVHIALSQPDADAPIGCVVLQRGRADWRSGSPGRATLTWPMAAIGFGFEPQWFGAPAPDAWLPAVQRTFPDHRLELRRCAPASVPLALPAPFELTEGIGTWVLANPGSSEQWLGSLYGKHRRDLAKYRRDIQKAGGEWIDTENADPELLDACFQLHRARLQDKGKQSAYFATTVENFLRALAEQTAGKGLRLSLLRREGRYIAACLSFVHRRRYEAFVSGWDRAHARFDLGRQVLYHQLLAELPRGLDQIDFLGGDLAYKREFGLQKRATTDAVCHGSRFATLRAHVVAGALQVYRRAQQRGPQRAPQEVR